MEVGRCSSGARLLLALVSFHSAEQSEEEAFSGLYEILPHLLFISLRSADLLLTGLTPSLGSHGGGVTL